MTNEGIIQKVFRKYNTFYESCANNEYFVAITPQEILRDLDTLQQELIAEIKRAYDMDGAEFLNKLIGDIE